MHHMTRREFLIGMRKYEFRESMCGVSPPRHVMREMWRISGRVAELHLADILANGDDYIVIID